MEVSSMSDISLNPLATPSVTTTYQAIVTDIYGCEDTVFQTVNVNPMPILMVSPDTTVCENSPVVFNVSGALSYNWFDQTGLGVTSSELHSVVLFYPTEFNQCSLIPLMKQQYSMTLSDLAKSSLPCQRHLLL